jgi:phosphate transport system substrate-binding protein
VLGLLGGVIPSEPAWAAVPISGAGSVFALRAIDNWRFDPGGAPNGQQVGYTANGSAFGRQQFSAGSADFGASDLAFRSFEIPTLTQQRCAGQALADCFVYVPVAAGGVALMYNLVDNSGQRVNNLQLTRRAACGIFTDAITKWNDPQIVATNPQLANFNRSILPVLRGDESGESYGFSQFCQAVAPDVWANFINLLRNDPNSGSDFLQGLPVANWPQGWGHSSTALYADGVANVVTDPATGPNSITMIAASYAQERNNWPVASLQNAAGQFVQPDSQNVTIGMSYASPNPDPSANGAFTMNFTGPDPGAYVPATFTYVLAQTGGWAADKGATLGTFLCYAVGKGQDIMPALGYASLSSELEAIARTNISKIPGAASADDCASGPTPPLLPEFPLPAAVVATVGVGAALVMVRLRRRTVTF